MGKLKEAYTAGKVHFPDPEPAMTPEQERRHARTEADLIALARKRGYRHPEWWARKVIEGRRKK